MPISTTQWRPLSTGDRTNRRQSKSKLWRHRHWPSIRIQCSGPRLHGWQPTAEHVGQRSFQSVTRSEIKHYLLAATMTQHLPHKRRVGNSDIFISKHVISSIYIRHGQRILYRVSVSFCQHVISFGQECTHACSAQLRLVYPDYRLSYSINQLYTDNIFYQLGRDSDYQLWLD